MGSGGGNVLKNPINTIVNPIGAITDPFQKMITGPAQGIGKNIIGGQNPGDQPKINIPGVTPPDYTGDKQQITDLTGQLNGLYGNQIQGVKDTYAQQQQAEQGQISKQVQDMISNLTSGQQGQDLAQHFNSLGLLHSGAFNQGLAQSFAPIEQQATNDILSQNQNQFGDIRSILGQQTGTNVNTDAAGTQRQFGLEDWYNNAMQNRNLAQSGANLQVQTGNQNAQSDLLGNLIGGGAKVAAK